MTTTIANSTVADLAKRDVVQLQGETLCLRQTEPHDCGPRALLTLMLQHAMPSGGLARIAELAGTNPATGSTIGGLAHAANSSGWDSVAVQWKWEHLDQLPAHCVARVLNADGRGHFVVLHAGTARNGQVIVSDPASGPAMWTRQALEARWRGELLLLLEPATKPSSER